MNNLGAFIVGMIIWIMILVGIIMPLVEMYK